jgi:1-acyl-sn-glycerol-3-phosphate acyltransferase
MTAIRSVLFNLLFFGWTGFVCVLLAWVPFVLPRPGVMAVVRWYLGTVAALERTVAGIRWELRGAENLPAGPFIAAAKHQSAWETMKLHALFGDPAIVHKRELLRIPVWGRFLATVDMIPIDRGARGRAVSSMLEGARRMAAQGRPIVIFPQGTRTAPGAWLPYKQGVAILYEELGLPIVPVALNSGVFWPRRSFLKRPGTIVVEVLPAIAPGLPRADALAELERRVEAASDRLVVAAGGPATARPAAGAEAAPVA